MKLPPINHDKCGTPNCCMKCDTASKGNWLDNLLYKILPKSPKIPNYLAGRKEK